MERDDLLGTLQGLHDEALAGSGRLALVHGEAGVGKSALVREWSAPGAARAAVLWGACDPLSSPRPLGPLVDVAPHLDPHGRRAAALGRARRPLRGRAGCARRRRTRRPGHRGPALGGHVHARPACASSPAGSTAPTSSSSRPIATSTCSPSDPLRVMLGDIASQPVVRRLEVPLLSPAAVAELAAESGIDADGAVPRDRRQRVLRHRGGRRPAVSTLPATVQDAVLARVHRLSPQARLRPGDRRGRSGRGSSRPSCTRCPT